MLAAPVPSIVNFPLGQVNEVNRQTSYAMLSLNKEVFVPVSITTIVGGVLACAGLIEAKSSPITSSNLFIM
jgi:hypothetical protein